MSVKDKKQTASQRIIGQWRWLLAMALGVAAVALVAWPARQTAQNNLKIASVLETEISGMSSWQIEGEAIQAAVSVHSREIDAQWQRMFPPRKGLDVLFLDLAHIADVCGVSDFYLAENIDQMSIGSSYESPGMGAGPAPGDDAPPTGEEEMVTEAVAIPLSSYTVLTRFQADLGKTALFLDRLESIDRALKVREITINENRDGIYVEMEIEVYVGETVQS